MYNEMISDLLNITPARARLVEALLRLEYSTLDALSGLQIRDDYKSGGISDAIDADPDMAERLAVSIGLEEVA